MRCGKIVSITRIFHDVWVVRGTWGWSVDDLCCTMSAQLRSRKTNWLCASCIILEYRCSSTCGYRTVTRQNSALHLRPGRCSICKWSCSFKMDPNIWRGAKCSKSKGWTLVSVTLCQYVCTIYFSTWTVDIYRFVLWQTRIALCKRCFDLGPMVYVHPYFLIGTFCLGYSDKYIALCDLFGPHICPYFM